MSLENSYKDLLSKFTIAYKEASKIEVGESKQFNSPTIFADIEAAQPIPIEPQIVFPITNGANIEVSILNNIIDSISDLTGIVHIPDLNSDKYNIFVEVIDTTAPFTDNEQSLIDINLSHTDLPSSIEILHRPENIFSNSGIIDIDFANLTKVDERSYSLEFEYHPTALRSPILSLLIEPIRYPNKIDSILVEITGNRINSSLNPIVYVDVPKIITITQSTAIEIAAAIEIPTFSSLNNLEITLPLSDRATTNLELEFFPSNKFANTAMVSVSSLCEETDLPMTLNIRTDLIFQNSIPVEVTSGKVSSDLSGTVTTRHNIFTNNETVEVTSTGYLQSSLPLSFTVTRSSSIESQIFIRRSNLTELLIKGFARQKSTSDLSSKISTKTYFEIPSQILTRRENSKDLPLKVIIPQRSQIEANLIVKTPSDLKSIIRVSPNNRMFGKILIYGTDKVDLLSRIAPRHAIDIKSSVISRQTKTLDLKSKITVPNRNDLSGNITTKRHNSLSSKISVRRFFKSDLNSQIAVPNYKSLSSKLVVKLPSDLKSCVKISPYNRMWGAVSVTQPIVTDLINPVIKDAFTREELPRINYGLKQDLLVSSVAGKNLETYLSFNVQDVPEGCLVKYINLKLWPKTITSSVTIDIYQVTGDWAEAGITWLNTPAAAQLLKTVTASPSDQIISWDLSDVVNTWKNDPTLYQGIKLVVREGSASFCSRESGVNSAPKIVIGYFNPLDRRSVGRVNLESTLDLRVKSYSELPGTITALGHWIYSDLPSSLDIKNPYDLLGDITISKGSLPSQLNISGKNRSDLDSSLGIRESYVDDFPMIISVSRDTLNLQFFIREGHFEDITAELLVKQFEDIDLESNLSVSRSTLNGSINIPPVSWLPSTVFVRTDLDYNLPSNITVSCRNITGTITIPPYSQILGTVSSRLGNETNLSGSICVTKSNLVSKLVVPERYDLNSYFNIRNADSKDLNSVIEILFRSNLPGLVHARRSGRKDLIGHIYVQKTADLRSSIYINRTDLAGTVIVPERINLDSSISIRGTAYADVLTFFAISTPDLPSSINVILPLRSELEGSVSVRLATLSELPGEIFVPYTDKVNVEFEYESQVRKDLNSKVDVSIISELPSSIYIPFKSEGIVEAWTRNNLDIESSLDVFFSELLNSSISVRRSLYTEIPASFIIKQDMVDDLTASINVMQVSDLQSSIIVPVKIPIEINLDHADLQGVIDVAPAANLPGQVIVPYIVYVDPNLITSNLPGSIVIYQNSDLLSQITIPLVVHVEIPLAHNDFSGVIKVGKWAEVDLISIVNIANRGKLDIDSNLAVLKGASLDLRLDTTAPIVNVILNNGNTSLAGTQLNFRFETEDTDVADMKIWGDFNEEITEFKGTEVASSWMPFTSVINTFCSRDFGNKTFHIKIRDDVWNETHIVINANYAPHRVTLEETKSVEEKAELGVVIIDFWSIFQTLTVLTGFKDNLFFVDLFNKLFNTKEVGEVTSTASENVLDADWIFVDDTSNISSRVYDSQIADDLLLSVRQPLEDSGFIDAVEIIIRPHVGEVEHFREREVLNISAKNIINTLDVLSNKSFSSIEYYHVSSTTDLLVPVTERFSSVSSINFRLDTCDYQSCDELLQGISQTVIESFITKVTSVLSTISYDFGYTFGDSILDLGSKDSGTGDDLNLDISSTLFESSIYVDSLGITLNSIDYSSLDEVSTLGLSLLHTSKFKDLTTEFSKEYVDFGKISQSLVLTLTTSEKLRVREADNLRLETKDIFDSLVESSAIDLSLAQVVIIHSSLTSEIKSMDTLYTFEEGLVELPIREPLKSKDSMQNILVPIFEYPKVRDRGILGIIPVDNISYEDKILHSIPALEKVVVVDTFSEKDFNTFEGAIIYDLNNIRVNSEDTETVINDSIDFSVPYYEMSVGSDKLVEKSFNTGDNYFGCEDVLVFSSELKNRSILYYWQPNYPGKTFKNPKWPEPIYPSDSDYPLKPGEYGYGDIIKKSEYVAKVSLDEDGYGSYTWNLDKSAKWVNNCDFLFEFAVSSTLTVYIDGAVVLRIGYSVNTQAVLYSASNINISGQPGSWNGHISQLDGHKSIKVIIDSPNLTYFRYRIIFNNNYTYNDPRYIRQEWLTAPIDEEFITVDFYNDLWRLDIYSNSGCSTTTWDFPTNSDLEEFVKRKVNKGNLRRSYLISGEETQIDDSTLIRLRLAQSLVGSELSYSGYKNINIFEPIIATEKFKTDFVVCDQVFYDSYSELQIPFIKNLKVQDLFTEKQQNMLDNSLYCENILVFSNELKDRKILYYWQKGYPRKTIKNNLWTLPMEPADIDYPYDHWDSRYGTSIPYSIHTEAFSITKDVLPERADYTFNLGKLPLTYTFSWSCSTYSKDDFWDIFLWVNGECIFKTNGEKVGTVKLDYLPKINASGNIIVSCAASGLVSSKHFSLHHNGATGVNPEYSRSEWLDVVRDEEFIPIDFYNDLWRLDIYSNRGCPYTLWDFPVKSDLEDFVQRKANKNVSKRKYIVSGSEGVIDENSIIRTKWKEKYHTLDRQYIDKFFTNYEFITGFDAEKIILPVVDQIEYINNLVINIPVENRFDISDLLVEKDFNSFDYLKLSATTIISLPLETCISIKDLSVISTFSEDKINGYDFLVEKDFDTEDIVSFACRTTLNILADDLSYVGDTAIFGILGEDLGKTLDRIAIVSEFKVKELIVPNSRIFVRMPLLDEDFVIDSSIIGIATSAHYIGYDNSKYRYLYLDETPRFIEKTKIGNLMEDISRVYDRAEILLDTQEKPHIGESIYLSKHLMSEDMGYICEWVQVEKYNYKINWIRDKIWNRLIVGPPPSDSDENLYKMEYIRLSNCPGIPPGGWPPILPWPIPPGYKPINPHPVDPDDPTKGETNDGYEPDPENPPPGWLPDPDHPGEWVPDPTDPPPGWIPDPNKPNCSVVAPSFIDGPMEPQDFDYPYVPSDPRYGTIIEKWLNCQQAQDQIELMSHLTAEVIKTQFNPYIGTHSVAVTVSGEASTIKVLYGGQCLLDTGSDFIGTKVSNFNISSSNASNEFFIYIQQKEGSRAVINHMYGMCTLNPEWTRDLVKIAQIAEEYECFIPDPDNPPPGWLPDPDPDNPGGVIPDPTDPPPGWKPNPDSTCSELCHLLSANFLMDPMRPGDPDYPFTTDNPRYGEIIPKYIGEQELKGKVFGEGSYTVSLLDLGAEPGDFVLGYYMFGTPSQIQVWYNENVVFDNKKPTNTPGEVAFRWEPLYGNTQIKVIIFGGKADTTWVYDYRKVWGTSLNPEWTRTYEILEKLGVPSCCYVPDGTGIVCEDENGKPRPCFPEEPPIYPGEPEPINPPPEIPQGVVLNVFERERVRDRERIIIPVSDEGIVDTNHYYALDLVLELSEIKIIPSEPFDFNVLEDFKIKFDGFLTETSMPFEISLESILIREIPFNVLLDSDNILVKAKEDFIVEGSGMTTELKTTEFDFKIEEGEE